MSLTCENDYDDDYGDVAYWYHTPTDFSVLETSRAKRCSSCKDLIKVGSTVLKYGITRPTRSEIEERIYGYEVEMANKYLCERCGDMAMNLSELGYCVDPNDDVRESIKQYKELTRCQN